MARLIPQKQIEEVNQFRDSISVGNSVFISGSLLVSQSIDIGTLASTKQRITGSVEITGSLQIDGALSFANAASRLDATASFSDISVDTQRFGGILVEDFAKSDSTIYVSSTNGNDNNSGTSPQFPLRTIKKAAQLATPGDDGRYGLPTGSLFSGFRITVDAGTYLEENPIELPRNTTVWGAGLRVTKIIAKNENEDLFWVNSGCYLAEMTFAGLRVYPSVDDSQSGFAIAFAPNAFITTSPYVQNCSMISNQENSFLELYEDIPAGGGGLNVDGNRIHPDSPLASMVLDAYTQVAPNGVGCQVVGRGFIQLVSFFTNFSAYSVKVIDGGHAVLLNSNTSFGDYGMYASGSRFITGSGGNFDAFLNVQDNYSIIVNTIEGGLSTIPPLVPNTENGIRVTDPNVLPQYFLSEDSSNEVADIVKADFTLISSIIDNGIVNKPSLIAKSSINGYSTASVYNISGENQYTSSTTASLQNIASIDTNFNILYDIIERGNPATESYVRISNVSHSIQATDIVQYITTPVESSTITTTNNSFDTIISIVAGGRVPNIVSNTSASFKFSDVNQYQTGTTSSLQTINSLSASFSIVYDTIEYGTGDLPAIIPSSSNASTSSEKQNAYNLLINNIPFIQEETIAFMSSSWSEFSYNETTCKRDISYIVSGAAYDILYGGNEESIKSARFYYLYPSEATTTQLEPTLTAVKYASGVAQNILKGRQYVTSSANIDNGYDIIFNNKDFVRAETIAYISSSWSEFEYNEASCSRDIGYILDAVGTDLKYKGNERTITAGQFYFRYPSLATSTQLNQTLDAIRYAKRLTEKLLNNDTFITASNSVIGAVDLMRKNRSLIQNETITYINTQYPNLDYNQTKCRRDVGYIVDNITTDLLYGGNERTETAGLYYFLYPSVANTTQLTETINALQYVNALTDKILISEILPIPKIGLNIDSNIKVTAFNSITSSISATNTEVTLVSQSFGIIEDIIRYGTDYIPSAIAGNSNDFNWNINNPINVSGITQIQSTLANENTQSISNNFDTIIKIIESGSSVTTEQTIGTDRNGAPISTVGIPKNSYGSNLITTVIGTTIPAEIQLIKNTEAGIKFGNDLQITSSISASVSEIQKVSSSFSIVTDIIKYGISGSLSLSGSSEYSTYYEVIAFESANYLFNENQLNKFDNVFTASIEDGIIDPTLTLKRGELYTFSVNSLNIVNATELDFRPFYIKTDIKPGLRNQYTKGVTNNGVTFGTLTFIVPFDAPDTLYYVNGKDIEASGIINIVDELPISDTQRYIEIPSLGDFEVVANTINNIKVGNIPQIQSIYTASISESLSVSSSFATTIDILFNGVGNLPTTITNVSGLIKKSELSQYTSSFAVSSALRNTISSSFNIVTNIVSNGTGSIPTLIENTEDLIKVTSQPQIVGLQSGSITQVNKVSSSFANIINIIKNGTGSIPVEISNINGLIKFSSSEQFTASLSASLEDVTFVSNSISIVSTIIANGSGSYITASLYGTASTQPSTLAAYEIIKENIPFIQIETLSYLSSSWSTASYNEASCSRDIALIVSGAAEDLLYNTISSSIVNGKYYLEFPSAAETTQINQTLDGIEYASKLTQKLIQNIIFETASMEVSASYNLIRKNREFVKSETIAYLSSSWSTFDYNESLCRRDIGHIIDAVSTDVLYGGNERSNTAGEFYYKYPSSATVSGSVSPTTAAQLYPTLDGINYARRLVQNIVVNNQFALAPDSRTNAYDLIVENKSLIQSEAVSYVSSSWSGVLYNDISCSRDIGYILDAVATDTLYGGNERSSVAGEFYYLFPSRATNGGVPSENNQLDSTLSGINYAKGMVNELLQNNIFVTASLQTIGVTNLIIDNKPLIQNEVISYISSSWSNFEYNEASCSRDVGYILDAVATDFYYGGNERSITAGRFYYLFPSAATVSGSSSPNVNAQLYPTVDGVTYAQRLTNKIINNTTLVTASLERRTTYELLLDNKSLIQNEVISFMSSSWSGFEYIESKCKRDVGYIVDAVATDVLYGGNERSVTAGEFYYLYPSQATSVQSDQTITGVNHAFGLADKIVRNTLLVTASVETIANYDVILDNKGLIQTNVISYIDSVYPYFTYNRTKCRRDVGYIVDAIATDLLWGGNERSIVAADYYYRYPSEATTIQLNETTEAIRYANAIVNELIQNNILEVPSIIKNTQNNIKFTNSVQYSGSMAISGSNLTDISSSFSIVTDVIKNGLISLPTLEKNTDNLIKVTNSTQKTSPISGSEVEVGIISASINMINDIIRLGSDNIPFAIAKNFDTTLDIPQNLSTGSYTPISGNYVVSDELAIVSGSFLQINDIIVNGLDALPTMVLNTENNIKVTNTNQYTSLVTGSSNEISIVQQRASLVENIVQNGTSVIPTIVPNNTNISKLIKVGNVEQYVSASGADKIQSEIVSTSFGLVIDIIANGSGSLPTFVDYTNPIDAPKSVLAYNLLKQNIPFIEEETILFMSSSWSGFVYDESKCRRDVGFIVSGAAEDLLWNANSASIVNGKFYLEYPSEATGSQLDQTLTALRYASNLAQNIVRNYEYVTASAEVSASYDLLVANKTFVQNETIAFVSSSWSGFQYNQTTCKRDVGYIIDAVATDVLYGGNERSVTAGRYYYDYPSAAIVGGVPSETQQKDPTVTAINYVKGLLTELVGGAVLQSPSNEVEYAYNSIRENRGFIQNEVIAFVNAKYPNLNYDTIRCKRDTGFIVDAVATDLRWGGNQRSSEAGRFYYLFPSKATNVQLSETTDAVLYASDLTKEIILKNTLFVPTASLNTDNFIKVTSTTQTLGTGTTEVSVLNALSSSFGLVMNVITNGTGSIPTISQYTASLTDSETLEAYSLIKSNIPFIQNEVIAYMSSSWSSFVYNEASCSRDVALIVSGAAEDLLFGSVSASVINAKYYFEYPSDATGSQLNQTLDGIRYAAGLTNKIVQSIEFTTASAEVSASYHLIRDNRGFIVSESIEYISSSWSTFSYNENTCKRDIGYIIDAISTDLLYGGNERSVTAGDFYYRYPSNATTSELEPTTTGIKYAGNLVEKLIKNQLFVLPTSDKIAGNETLLNNRSFIQNEVIAYISSSWSGFEYNEASCSRDTGYIVDAVATDLLYGGNERSRTAGEYYYKFPSSATVSGSVSPTATAQLYPTLDGVKYASGVAQKLVQNIQFVTASTEVSASWNLLRDNKEFIQNEVIAYVSSSWSGVYYNEDKCKRDVGYLIDAAATDLYYGGNERSVTAGSFYYLFPSAATQNGVPSTTSQLDPTVDGIIYASGLSQKVIQNTKFVQPTSEVLVGAELLIGNKKFIQTEVIEYLSSSWSEFYYNEASCSRDIGYIIDAARTDLVYGGNERSIKAGTFYYYIPSEATTKQKPQTIDGIDFAKGMAEKVILKDQLVRPAFQTKKSADLLKGSKKTLQSIAISYTAGAFPNFVYNEEKCYRDTGFIVDAIATDLLYGGNVRSIRAASSYYTGVYGSAAVVVNEQKKETAETNRYLRTQFQRIVRNAPIEEFGSLIITTGHDFSYSGAGVTYKALPFNQGGAGVADPTKEITELAGGRVYFTSGNELGDFKIGTGLIINQATGTLQGRTFSRSLFSLVTPFSLALEG